MARRTLLLSAAFGSGHYQAALSVGEACEQLYVGSVARAVNLESPLLRGTAEFYLTLLSQAPGLYRRLYHAPVGPGTRRLIRLALVKKVWREVKAFHPDLIVATHPFPAAAAAHLRQTGALAAPLHVVLTDFAPHPLWVHTGVDRYFVASSETARRLQILGVASGRISVTGIPVPLRFAGVARTGSAGAAALPGTREGIGPVRRVLVMGGGLGLGPIVEAVRSLAQLRHPNLAFTVICGRNELLRRELTDLFGSDRRFAILGYSDQIPALMAGADLLVTKPGGITCSEALASGLPMLLLPPLPGHEQENAEHLVRTGAAGAVDEQSVRSEAEELLFSGTGRLERMREAALASGRPHAAKMVANEIFIFPEPNRHTGTTG